MVMAPANTGRERRSRIAVIKTDHTNKGTISNFMLMGRIFKIVVIKLIAPKIEEAPAKCKEKIVISIADVLWNIWFDKGGYTVHPVPAPESVNDEMIRSEMEGGNNQNLMLFIRGKAMSGAVIIKGTSQFPNPPIMIGITIKKIMIKAWAVTITLKIWSFWPKIVGWESLNRMIKLIEAPNIPAHKPNPKYIVPISLWFVEYIHRVNIMG